MNIQTYLLISFIVFPQLLKAQELWVPSPELVWQIDTFSDREFMLSDVESLLYQGGERIKNYKPGSFFWRTLDSQKVAVRVMEKGHIGASGDFWYVNANLQGDSAAYTGQMYIFFPEGFFAQTRAGKLPNSFKSQQDVALDSMSGNGFASIVMFWADVDENGKTIPPGKMDTTRQTAAIGDYSYVQSLPQKGEIYGNRQIYTWPDGSGVRLTEGEWWGLTQIVRLNSVNSSGVPNADGYIRAYVAKPSASEGKWVLVGQREGLIFREKESSFGIGQYDMPWFQGGGSRKPVPEGYGPLKTVEAYARGWTVWAGEVVPQGRAFTANGKPLR
ncbi:MAG: hypothetical protein SF052_11430 [Bacteroidia bacterium]|nr:hypothetical protein [Bacteroidia bacterium]